VGVLWLAAGGSARAQQVGSANICIAELSDEQVSEQLAFVEQSLAQQRLPAAAWWTTWNGFNIFNLAFGFYKYATAETRLAADSWLVSAIGAGLFVAAVSIAPLPGMYGYRRLSRIPEVTPEQRRQKLERGVYWLSRAANTEAFNSNWVAHLIGVVYATVSSAYVWIRNRNADPHELALAVSLQFVSSIGVAELTFWSTPRRARRDLKTVGAAVCEPLLRTGRTKPEQSLKLSLFPGHATLTGRF